jgi:hypothetical protein
MCSRIRAVAYLLVLLTFEQTALNCIIEKTMVNMGYYCAVSLFVIVMNAAQSMADNARK